MHLVADDTWLNWTPNVQRALHTVNDSVLSACGWVCLQCIEHTMHCTYPNRCALCIRTYANDDTIHRPSDMRCNTFSILLSSGNVHIRLYHNIHSVKRNEYIVVCIVHTQSVIIRAMTGVWCLLIIYYHRKKGEPVCGVHRTLLVNSNPTGATNNNK